MMSSIDDLLGLTREELEWNHMVLRAVVVFILAIILIRVTGMRTFGTQSAFDIVLSITISGVLSRCITGHYPFFPTLLAATTLAVCHRLVAALSRYGPVNKVIQGVPVCLYSGGKLHGKMFKWYSISENDLHRVLREHGLENMDKVDKIWYEVDGKISVIMKPGE
jgi:uncharacterized membrane protein YcaP (DUF421 family)